jgi:hypothetical protein
MIDNVCTGSTHWYRQNINPLSAPADRDKHPSLSATRNAGPLRGVSVNQFRDALRDLDIVIASQRGSDSKQ